MATTNLYEGVQHVVEINTNIGKGCEHCAQEIGTDRFAESINHYIEKHGYKVLHVGTQTIPDMNGNPYHTTPWQWWVSRRSTYENPG
jgi:hypothetical protein